MTQKEFARAQAQGKAAFLNGLDRAPVLDPSLWTLLRGKAVGEGAPVLCEWLRGWDLANLAADW